MNFSPHIIRTRSSLHETILAAKRDGKRVGFVPTMGALHEGHLSLVTQAQSAADLVVTSIFVNPTQFAPGEDLDTYPRTETSDIEKLSALGCDIVYLPTVEEMYPEGSVTNVRVEGLSDLLDGQFRSHFFYGVATIVARLFIHVQPDVAVFGEKDYQQLQIIRRMVRDLGFPIDIIGGPTERDVDGLALSSRNAYLAPEERQRASSMSAALHRAASRLSIGAPLVEVIEEARTTISNAGFETLDYVSAVHPDTLQALAPEDIVPGFGGRLLTAAWMGKTRLIDNLGFFCGEPA